MNVNNYFRTRDFFQLISEMKVLDRGIMPKPLKDAFDEFLMDLRLEKKSRETITFYKKSIEPLLNQANAPHHVNEVNPSHIRSYLILKEHLPHTLHKRYRALRAFFNWAMKQRYTKDNPVLSLKAPKLPKKIIPTLAPDDVKALLKQCPDTFLGRRDKAVVLVLFDTGMRVSELFNLTLNDIDLENGLLKIKGKGNKERIVRIGTNATKALWNYLKVRNDREDKVWLSEEKKPLTTDGIRLLLKRLKNRAGIKARVNPHTFRHTFAINFLRAGGDIFNLQTLGGWESLEMVKRYAATLNEDDAVRAHQRFSPGDRLF